MGRCKNNREKLLTRQQIIKKYGITKKLIQQFFPKPEIIRVRGRGGSWWTLEGWTAEDVEKDMHKQPGQLKSEKDT